MAIKRRAKKQASQTSNIRAKAKLLKREAARRARKPGFPPPDNPLMRHEELDEDRRIIGEARVPRRGRASVAKAAPGERRTQMAALRLRAISEARTDSSLARSLTRDEAGAEADQIPAPSPMAPAVGVSNWVQLGPSAIPNGQTYGGGRVLVTGRVTAIVVHPTSSDTVYAGTAQGGVWKTIDGGAHWKPTSDNELSLAIGALCMDPSDAQTLYAGTGEGNFSQDSYYGAGVLKTTDGGNTWTALATATFTGARFCRIAITPGTPSRLFAATSAGLYRSINSGAVWSAISSAPMPSSFAVDVAIDPATPTTVYAAFWGNGIYKTNNAQAANPTWTKLAGGLPSATAAAPAGFTRLVLGISASSPQTLYALFANNRTTPGATDAYQINKLFVTTDGGTSWTAIPLPGGNIGGQGFYNLNIAVDPTTPDIVYLSGISLWKGTRNAATGAWTFVDIGGAFHPDNHVLAFHPTNHLVVYAGSDGGIYRSTDGGASWDDSINKGICIAQFEFIDQHPTNDAVVIGGTQDNGTEQLRNGPVFYHSADGDGGFVVIDQTQPRNVVHTYYGPSPERSTLGAKWGDYTSTTHIDWTDVSGGLFGASLFYPPMALNQANQSNIAFGTDRIFLDATQGTGGWPTQIPLPGPADRISAICYVDATLIYVGTEGGRVFKLSRSGTTWSATALHAAPLPPSFIWDIATIPGDPKTIVLVMSGFGIAHAWRGVVPTLGAATWTDISGTGAVLTPTTPGRLPDIPVNALAIEPGMATTLYVGTDVGVFTTSNSGTTWSQMSEGLPNCAIFDLRLHNPSRLLRAATHGRGLWERRLDVALMPAVDLFVRDHLMHSGRATPSPANVAAAFEDPLQYVNLGDTLNWWMCADIKVDALGGAPPAYQMNVADVDYVRFESRLQHRNAARGRVNRVYVQIHNRGFQSASNVTVKLLYANASPGLPNLPADFWTAFPGDSTTSSAWAAIGPAQTIATLSPTEPSILEWDWTTPSTAADHTCLLAVIDCAADPIPAAAKIFDVGQLVRDEKRVGLKNLHIVDPPPGTSAWTMIDFFPSSTKAQAIRMLPSTARGWTIGLLFPKGTVAAEPTQQGFKPRKPTQAALKQLKARIQDSVSDYDTTRLFMLADFEKGALLDGVKLAKTGTRVFLWIEAPASTDRSASLTLVQEQEQQLIGGNTFVLRGASKTRVAPARRRSRRPKR
ncbi:MAG TPA: hypothetical protein VGL25_02520 [Casimicrobiaceae bacterium]